jgi:hypothetical protein
MEGPAVPYRRSLINDPAPPWSRDAGQALIVEPSVVFNPDLV